MTRSLRLADGREVLIESTGDQVLLTVEGNELLRISRADCWVLAEALDDVATGA